MQQQQLENKKRSIKKASIKSKYGYITLSTILILSAIAVIVVTTTLTLSLDTTSTLTTIQSNRNAKAMANSCAEIALDRLKSNPDTYAGNETITIGSNSCIIQPISGSGLSNRIIQAESTVNGATIRLEVFVNTVNPLTDIEYWEEVSNF